MSVATPESQETLVNDIHDDSTPNVEVSETGQPEPPVMSAEDKDEINQMTYKELESKLEEEKKNEPPVIMPQSM